MSRECGTIYGRVSTESADDALPTPPAKRKVTPVVVRSADDAQPTPPAKRKATPISNRLLVVLMLVTMNEAVSFNVLWPFLPFYVRDVGISEDNVGLMVGILASSFFFAQFLSSFLWGVFADTYGRRPALLLGTMGATASMVLFGFSTSYYVGLTARVCCGLLNGVISITKTYLGEITDKTNQSRGFSLLAFAWGLGSILGSVAGGFLARPAHKYPGTVSPDGFLGRFPYLLPCLFSALVGVSGITLGYFFLPETKKWLDKDALRRMNAGERAPVLLLSALDEGDEHVPERATGDDADYGGDTDQQCSVIINAEHPDVLRFEQLDTDEPSEGEVPEEGARPHRSRREIGMDEVELVEVRGQDPSERRLRCGELTDSESHTPVLSRDHTMGSLTGTPSPKGPSKLVASLLLLRNPHILRACTSYGLVAAMYILYDEILPVYAATETARGGLSFTTDQIGVILTIQGVILIPFQFLIYKRICDYLGLLRTFRLGLWLSIPAFVTFSLLTYARQYLSIAMVWAFIVVLCFMKVSAAATAFTSATLLVNNSSSEDLGTVNGIGQSFSSLARGLGPLVGGGLFSAFVSLDFPLHQSIAYLLMVLIVLVALGVARGFTELDNVPWSDREELMQELMMDKQTHMDTKNDADDQCTTTLFRRDNVTDAELNDSDTPPSDNPEEAATSCVVHI